MNPAPPEIEVAPAAEGCRKRILFVDDEANVLDGLRRMLRPLRAEWDMHFEQDPHKALEWVDNEPCDVVVTDMRMPGLDGGQLLNEIRRRHPEVARIVLSGHSTTDGAIRLLGATHQYLSKPCDPDRLKVTVARTCALRDLMAKSSLRTAVAGLSHLPSLPDLYVRLIDAIESPDTSINEIAEIVARDLGMTAKVLQIVNSAFFGLRHSVSDPSKAVSMLGLETLRALALSAHVFLAPDERAPRGFSLSGLWDHSMRVSLLAKNIALEATRDMKLANEAFTAGLLHDVGKVALAFSMPDAFETFLETNVQDGFWSGEREAFGATHGEVGAYLLGLWGLPDPIVEAAAFHHQPRQCPAAAFVPLTAVHAADCLDHEFMQETPMEGSRIDVEYLHSIGCERRVAAWRAFLAVAVAE